MERINKVLARSTDFSRREIDKFIMEGRIKVDGKLLTCLLYTSDAADE